METVTCYGVKMQLFTDGRTNQFELGNGFVTELSFNADAQLQTIKSAKQGFPNALNIGYTPFTRTCRPCAVKTKYAVKSKTTQGH